MGGILDHSPIYLELLGPFPKPSAPFKFNSAWLMNPNYIKLITDFWLSHPPNRGRTPVEGFYHNILKIKILTIKWAKEKRDRDDAALTSIKLHMADLLDENCRGFLSNEENSPHWFRVTQSQDFKRP